MGTNEFTKEAIDKLRVLIADLETSEANEKKKIRAKMRRIGFYITDFDQSRQGFTVAQLQELLDTGIVVVSNNI
ncbi:MAG: hypothetical protein BGO41_11465 [Clostridiales bacterium 38-18]|nr:MAG: hypothetical protein BGO41_11465 [Clostridiales bacterium 38-18]